jgi:hypothetical protein
MMKIERLVLFIAAGILLSVLPTVNAGVTVFNLFNSPDSSLTLTNGVTYNWLLERPLAPGEHVTGATITYVDVLATNYSPTDRVITNLIDTPHPANSYVGTYDPDGRFYSYFDSCFRYHEGWTTAPATYTYDLGSSGINLLGTVESYLQNPTFSVSTNPLGDYTVKNIIFTLTTEITPVVPVPGAILLVGLGVGITGYIKKLRIL